jgi:hypothetical protein
LSHGLLILPFFFGRLSLCFLNYLVPRQIKKPSRRLFFAPLRGATGYGFVTVFVFTTLRYVIQKHAPKPCVNGVQPLLAALRKVPLHPGGAYAQGGAGHLRYVASLKLRQYTQMVLPAFSPDGDLLPSHYCGLHFKSLRPLQKIPFPFPIAFLQGI